MASADLFSGGSHEEIGVGSFFGASVATYELTPISHAA
jgi:hypothetical protein